MTQLYDTTETNSHRTTADVTEVLRSAVPSADVGPYLARALVMELALFVGAAVTFALTTGPLGNVVAAMLTSLGVMFGVSLVVAVVLFTATPSHHRS